MDKRTAFFFVAVALVFFALGAGLGRRYGFTKTVEVEKRILVEKETTVVNQKIDIDELKKLIADVTRKNNVVTTRKTVKAPDGTTTVEERTEDKTEVTKHTESSSANHTAIATDTRTWKETTKLEERLKLTETKLEARWAFDVQVGYQLPALWNREAGFNLVPTRGIVVGASAYRRVLGPFWLGVWANSTAMAGGGLRWSF